MRLEHNDKGQTLHADSAYTGENPEKLIRSFKMKNKVHEKGYKGKPLTAAQKKRNNKKSTVRARVEHIFGFMEQSMNGLQLKCIGFKRAFGTISLINLTYNLFRYEQTVRLKLIPWK